MFTDMQFEVVDFSKIRTCLASYPPELREQAIEAIQRLGLRIRRSIVYMAPDTGWLNVEREGMFTITYQAFVDRFDLLCSATIWMRRRRRSGIGFLTVAAVG